MRLPPRDEINIKHLPEEPEKEPRPELLFDPEEDLTAETLNAIYTEIKKINLHPHNITDREKGTMLALGAALKILRPEEQVLKKADIDATTMRYLLLYVKKVLQGNKLLQGGLDESARAARHCALLAPEQKTQWWSKEYDEKLFSWYAERRSRKMRGSALEAAAALSVLSPSLRDRFHADKEFLIGVAVPPNTLLAANEINEANGPAYLWLLNNIRLVFPEIKILFRPENGEWVRDMLRKRTRENPKAGIVIAAEALIASAPKLSINEAGIHYNLHPESPAPQKIPPRPITHNF